MSRELQSRHEAGSFYCCSKTISYSYAYAWFISCLIVYSSSLFAKDYIQISHSGRVLKEHTFKDVCIGLTGESALLIEKKGTEGLSCLGTVVSISEFCRKKQGQDNSLLVKAFSRSITLEKDDLVLCEYIDSVRLSISCRAKLVEKECLFPRKSCSLIKKRYAQDLELLHFSNPLGDEVNCHFVQNRFLDSFNL